MDMTIMEVNAAALTQEMAWLAEVIGTRMRLFQTQDCPFRSVFEVPAPDLAGDPSLYGKVVKHYSMTLAERIVLALALAPHLQPHLLDVFFTRNADYDRGFTEFGGIKGLNHGGFLPTGETAAFLLAANSLQQRFAMLDLFMPDHFFRKFNILTLGHPQADEPFLSGMIRLSEEYLSFFTRGVAHRPDFSAHFPAKRIHTDMDWSDLVLETETLQGVEEIRDWLEYGDVLLHDWGMAKKIKPGFRVLFHGPPGTGKTFTATLLGKSSGRDVYRVDLSMVVSKYIGETEKNLRRVFDAAEEGGAILLFDEADALFGKRSEVKDAHDRYANLEIGYLLQRMEEYEGVTILASNRARDMDEAFTRRFQFIIDFPMPDEAHRLKIWQGMVPSEAERDGTLDLATLAKRFETSGGEIKNAVLAGAFLAAGAQVPLRTEHLIRAVRREFRKGGRLSGERG
jgi:hypothetical protein